MMTNMQMQTERTQYTIPKGLRNQGSRCYKVEDLMDMLGIGKAAVYALIKRQEFRVLRLPGVGFRIPKDSFDHWMSTGTANE